MRKFRRASSFTRRELERLMGLLLFVSIVDPILKTSLKDLNRVLVSKARRRRRDIRVPMMKKVQALLKPWASSASLKRSVPLVPPPVSVIIHTDASLEGWGGHSETKSVSGRWSPAVQTCHINTLELMAVFLTLRSLRPMKGSHIRLFIDNQVAVSCLRRGGSRAMSLNHAVLAIARLAYKHNWFLSPVHLAGAQNVLADSLSRLTPQEGEWSLDNLSFQNILREHPLLEIDLFATRENNKLPRFITS